MDNLLENKPVLIGAAVVIVLAALLMSRSSGGSVNTAGVSASLQSQQIASATDVQLSQINQAASVARGAQAADMFKAGVTANASVATASSAASVAEFTAFMQHLDNQANIAAARDVQTQTISAGHDVAVKTLDTQMTQYFDSLSFADRHIKDILANDQALAKIKSSESQALATIGANNTQALAQINANVANNRTSAGTTHDVLSSLPSLIDIGMSLFG